MEEVIRIYHVETQEDYDDLMVMFEELGVLWNDGTIPTDENCWTLRKEETAICLYDDDTITHGSLVASKRYNPDSPIRKHKAKQNGVQPAIETTSKNNVELFNEIITDLEKVYIAKNQDYGNSFEESLNEFGEVAGLVRIGDKFNRAKNLSKNKANVIDESKIDTYLDMANYCIMQAMWLMKSKL